MTFSPLSWTTRHLGKLPVFGGYNDAFPAPPMGVLLPSGQFRRMWPSLPQPKHAVGLWRLELGCCHCVSAGPARTTGTGLDHPYAPDILYGNVLALAASPPGCICVFGFFCFWLSSLPSSQRDKSSFHHRYRPRARQPRILQPLPTRARFGQPNELVSVGGLGPPYLSLKPPLLSSA